MIRKRLLSAAALLVLANVSPATAITGGQFDGDEHPFVGSFVADWRGRGLEPYCTGTLISPTVFLSAAHCLTTLEERGVALDDLTVQFDADFGPATVLHTGTAIMDPRFSFPGGHGGFADMNDLAVFVLDARLEGVQPAPLPPLGMLDARDLRDAQFTAVGFGATRWDKTRGFNSFVADDRRYASAPSFRALTPGWIELSSNLATGDGGACYGDSGGPILLDGVITSVIGAVDANCRSQTAAYRLDTESSREFLRRYVALP